ncbi:eukaryotic translation initiation factor 2B delta subunit [Mycena maculata]|uniref:Translation initiation factor eIF2B subunit delta n=1 Tax=Mycena maculata TaxID=230809 RepID=A0AAD7JXY5_9AGAR|nr:eukaryotic translation initiation factor 2B delta subunit [Mycena maculata]
MSVPTTSNEVTASGLSSQPSQKNMSKAERRELQEKQRAAKLAQKQQPQTADTPNKPKSKPKPAAAQKKSSSGPTETAQSSAPDASRSHPKDATSAPIVDGEATSKSRSLRIFSHFGLPKHGHGAKGDIHPCIVKLALQFSEFRISGANARCIATLTAFKTVIQDYTTPPNNTLSRHLMTHLSPQITHLVSARPMSVTMGNAIRQLKLEISGSDIDMPEQDAKDLLCQKIDDYIRDRIIIADEVIQDFAGKKIKDGDVILTYARSSVVEKVLLSAYRQGKRFSVIVVDSRPLLEGKALLQALTSAPPVSWTLSNDSLLPPPPPIPCTYALLPALPSLITEATTVILGAHSLHSNGAVFSRAGTALVAMMAKQHSVPVLVCCETYKFSEGVMLDGFGKNELAPSHIFQTIPTSPLTPNLEILNPLYDLTPPSCITAVVTEVGLIPPSSISTIPMALGRINL